MLVLSRKVGERIQVGDDVTITVVRINAHAVRLGIEAPGNLEIVREELVKAGAGSDAKKTERNDLASA
jgi:carbon storage regulator